MRIVALRWVGIFVLWAAALQWAQPAGEPAKLQAVLLDGNRVNLEQWKGKVVMVNFWATWCPVCRAEMPQWQKFYERNRSRGFEMIAVSVDDGEEEVRAFMAAKGYTFPVAWRFDKREDDDFPTVHATPTTYFVDRQGRVAAMRVGQISGGFLEQTVERLLAQ
ncbi:MAG TPA: TlpA disulfide reductase family protein [Burkholderiales bacterium]|nr:TlpA disulfide reductase family protein [Burkholderiales bacterium]